MDLFKQSNLDMNKSGTEQIEEKFSLKKIMATDTKEMIFKLNKQNNSISTSKCSEKKQYHEINVSRLNDKIIVQIINISSRVIDEMDEQ